jgi:hypothetical protein
MALVDKPFRNEDHERDHGHPAPELLASLAFTYEGALQAATLGDAQIILGQQA